MTLSYNIKTGILRSNSRTLPNAFSNGHRIRAIGDNHRSDENVCDNSICNNDAIYDPRHPGQTCVFTVGCETLYTVVSTLSTYYVAGIYDVYGVGGTGVPDQSLNFGKIRTLTTTEPASGLSGGQIITIITPTKTWAPGTTSYNYFVEVVPTGSATNLFEPIPAPDVPADYRTNYGVYYPTSGTPNRKVVRSQGHWGYQNAVLYTDLSCVAYDGFYYPPSSISDTRPNCLCATGSGLNITIELPAYITMTTIVTSLSPLPM